MGPHAAVSARQQGAHTAEKRVSPATMPKEMTASEEYTRAQEQTSLERVFNNLDKKGDGKVRRSDDTWKHPLPAAPQNDLAALSTAD